MRVTLKDGTQAHGTTRLVEADLARFDARSCYSNGSKMIAESDFIYAAIPYQHSLIDDQIIEIIPTISTNSIPLSNTLFARKY